MARTLLIDEQYIKDNSAIDENVDVKLLLDAIWTSQREHIKPLLGTDLFDDIIAKADAATLAGNDLILVDTYIAPTLLKWVIFEMTLVLSYKYRNKGVMQQNSDNSTSTGSADLRTLLDHWRHKAEMFANDTVQYLRANTDLFPLYLTNSDFDDIQPKASGYTSGLFLGRANGANINPDKDCCA